MLKILSSTAALYISLAILALAVHIDAEIRIKLYEETLKEADFIKENFKPY